MSINAISNRPAQIAFAFSLISATAALALAIIGANADNSVDSNNCFYATTALDVAAFVGVILGLVLERRSRRQPVPLPVQYAQYQRSVYVTDPSIKQLISKKEANTHHASKFAKTTEIGKAAEFYYDNGVMKSNEDWAQYCDPSVVTMDLAGTLREALDESTIHSEDEYTYTRCYPVYPQGVHFNILPNGCEIVCLVQEKTCTVMDRQICNHTPGRNYTETNRRLFVAKARLTSHSENKALMERRFEEIENAENFNAQSYFTTIQPRATPVIV